MTAMVAHGMTAKPAPRDWPPLTIAELAPVLDLYPGLGPARAVTWQSPRPFAASGTVACRAGDIFVKRHHSAVRTASDLAEEHAFIAHLRAAGAPVPQLLARADGATATQIGPHSYELFALSPGLDLYRHDVSWTPIRGTRHAGEAGRALGILHRAAAGFDAPKRRTHMLVADFSLFDSEDPRRAVADRASAWPPLAAALAARPWRTDMARVLLPWHAALTPHLTALTPLWTHNDFHASNLLWQRDHSVATVLDFGLANRTSAAFDLATAIERNAIAWLRLADGDTDIGHPDLAAALIRGYIAETDLPPGQAAALPHLLPLVHVDFALSELGYFHAVTQSPRNADLAYHDFLLGHAAWFATAHGQDFLAALKAVLF
jgi:Ser/Thr protein kinase RdoA (MazF antagonist)